MKKYFLGLILFCWSVSFTIQAKELKIAFPAKLPPWTIQEKNSGITIDIVRAALAHKGHTLQVSYLDLGTLNQDVSTELDAHSQVESKALKGFYSEKVMIFQTSLIALQSRNLKISALADLNNLRVVAFLNASFLFGKEFQEWTNNNAKYQEIADQEEQISMLYRGDLDLILADKNIFLYFRRITSVVDTSAHYQFHFIPGITEASPAFVVFKEETLRDEFNEGLQHLRSNREYYKIFAKYVR